MYRGFYPIVGLIMAASSGSALANPQGGSVAAGSASITSAPGQVTVNQSSNKVVINWQGFSIGPGEITRFNQPSSGAIALNRVTGGDPSLILGQLSANGRILLINPNGVLFGAGSRVDVAGLIATTANLSDQDFMAGSLNFSMPSSSPTASVVNRGTISVAQGGLVALVAPGVANDGVIQARLGRVSLVSADRFTVDFHGDQLIRFALDDTVARTVVAPDGMALSAAVSNAGRIVANGGTVQMSANVASGVLDHVIDMSGVIEVRSVRKVNGTVVLDGGAAGTVAVSGRIDAAGRGTNQTGGTVQILGQHVGLFSGADVNVSGGAGGGTVLVGGNQHGQGPQPNAEATYVDPNATITADATVKGNGGTVVVWSDQYTNFAGSISARGGPQGGNGGNVETSSHNILTATGQVNAGAPQGKGGQWLLDPTDIQITNATSMGAFDNGSPTNTFTPAGTGTAQVDVGTITGSLNVGTNVVINTASSDTQNGDITLATSITMTGTPGTPPTLTLNAAGSFLNPTNNNITTSGGAFNLTINTGNNSTIHFGGSTSLGGGTLTVSSAGATITQAGAITNATASIDAGNGTITLTNGGNQFVGLTLTNTGTNNVSVTTSNDLVLAGASSVGNGTLTLTSLGGQITDGVAGTIAQAAGASVSATITASSTIDLGNANTFTGPVSLNNSSGANVLLQTTGALVLATSNVSNGTTHLMAGGGISQTGALIQNGGFAGPVILQGGAGSVTLTNSGNVFSSTVQVTNSGNNPVSVTDSVALAVNNMASQTIGGSLTLTADQITTPGTVKTLGGGTLTIQPLTASTNVRFGGAAAGLGLVFDDAQRGNYTGFTGFVAGSATGTGTVTLGASETLGAASLTLQSNGAGGTVALAGHSITTQGGAITLTAGNITMGGGVALDTTQGGSSGAAIALNGTVFGVGQALTLNAGTVGDITLHSIGASGSTLGALDITNAHNVTGSGQVNVDALTQSAGTGTTNFGGAGVVSGGTVQLTTAAIAGSYNVNAFTVTSGQTVATGSIAGTGGSPAALLATDPSSTGTQTFNGCTIGTATCASSGSGSSSGGSSSNGSGSGNGSTASQTNTINGANTGFLASSSGNSADPNDPDNSNVHGFEVQIPTQNVDWSDPAGNLRVKLAPEYQSLSRYFYGSDTSNRLLGRSNR